MLIISMFIAIPAFAGDLKLKVNEAENTISITNALPNEVYLMDIVSGDRKITLHMKMAAGGTAVFNLMGKIPPDAVDYVSGIIFGNAPAGHARGSDGLSHLSADML